MRIKQYNRKKFVEGNKLYHENLTFCAGEAICPCKYRYGQIARNSRKARAAIYDAASSLFSNYRDRVYVGFSGTTIVIYDGIDDDGYDVELELTIPEVTLKDCLCYGKRKSIEKIRAKIEDVVRRYLDGKYSYIW